MYKKFTGIVLCIIMTLSFAATGCVKGTNTGGPGEGEKSQSQIQVTGEQEKVKITFWHNYGADKETPFFNDTILPMFKEKYPNIEVEAVAQGNDQYREQIVISAGTNTTPDVARLDINHVAGLAKIDALRTIDDLEGFDDLMRQVFAGPLSANLYKGRYYGLPLDTNCKTAVFNMAKLKELGFEDIPETMDEFIQKSRENSNGKYTISVSGAGEWDFMPYFWLFGGVMSNDDFTKTSGYLDSQQSIDAMNELVKLHDDGILTIKNIDGTTDAWDGIKSGEYAMFFEGPWFFTFTSDWKELGLKPGLIPSYNGKTTSVIGGESIGIFSSTKNAQAAFTFIEFLLSEEIQVLMGKEMGQMPVLKAAADDVGLNENEVWRVYLEQLDTALTRIPSPEKSTIEEYIKDAFDLILRKESSVEEVLKEAARLIDAELEK